MRDLRPEVDDGDVIPGVMCGARLAVSAKEKIERGRARLGRAADGLSALARVREAKLGLAQLARLAGLF